MAKRWTKGWWWCHRLLYIEEEMDGEYRPTPMFVKYKTLCCVHNNVVYCFMNIEPVIKFLDIKQKHYSQIEII